MQFNNSHILTFFIIIFEDLKMPKFFMWISEILDYHYHYTLMYMDLCYGGTCGVGVVIVWNGQSDEFKILDKTVCISHNANTLGKDTNPVIFSPAVGK